MDATDQGAQRGGAGVPQHIGEHERADWMLADDLVAERTERQQHRPRGEGRSIGPNVIRINSRINSRAFVIDGEQPRALHGDAVFADTALPHDVPLRRGRHAGEDA